MNELTLRELCNACGVSRRAVQGYEKNGLVSATGKTNRGYLLYDIAARNKVAKIRRYQEYGFSVKEIKEIFDNPSESQKVLLIEKLNELEKKRENIDKCIKEIEAMIKE